MSLRTLFPRFEEQNAKLDAATKMIQEVLTLRVQEPDTRVKKGKR